MYADPESLRLFLDEPKCLDISVGFQLLGCRVVLSCGPDELSWKVLILAGEPSEKSGSKVVW